MTYIDTLPVGFGVLVWVDAPDPELRLLGITGVAVIEQIANGDVVPNERRRPLNEILPLGLEPVRDNRLSGVLAIWSLTAKPDEVLCMVSALACGM